MSQRSQILNMPSGYRELQPEIDATMPTYGLEVRTISNLMSNIFVTPERGTSKLGVLVGVYGHYVGFKSDFWVYLF